MEYLRKLYLLYGLSANLRHDVAFSAQVLVAKRQEAVDDERWNGGSLDLFSVRSHDSYPHSSLGSS